MVVPTDLSGLSLWLKADALTGYSNGDFVTSWPDSSGNGNNATQPFGTARNALYRPSGAGSLPTLEFDGDDAYVSAGSPSNLASQTIFVVCRPTSLASGTHYLRAGGDGLAFGCYTTDPAKLSLVKPGSAIIGTGSTTLSTALATSTGYVVTAAFSTATSWALYVNGTSDGGSSTGTTIDPTTPIDGAIGADGPFGGNGWAGNISEMIVYSRVVTSTERASIHSYLQDKYGITVADYIIPPDSLRLPIQTIQVP